MGILTRPSISSLTTCCSITLRISRQWWPSCNSQGARECGQSSGGASDHFVRYSGSQPQAEVLPPSPARDCVLTLLRSDDSSDRRAEQYHRIAALHHPAIGARRQRNVCAEE